MIVSVGSDHAGFQLKVKMLPILKQWGFEGFVVTDFTGISEMIEHGVGD